MYRGRRPLELPSASAVTTVNLMRAVGFLAPYWRRFLLILAAVGVGALLGLAPPFLIRSIIDSARRSSTGKPMPNGVIPRRIRPMENGDFELQVRSPGPPQYLLVYLRGTIEKAIPIEVVPGESAFQVITL